MSRISHLRLIIETEPQSGAWNMAVDETLLESALSDGVATLRWYQWREATVSLGYFQKLIDWQSDPVLSQLPVVRRLSGGGAIVHDDEITYSLSLPARQSLYVKPEDLYDIVHESLVDELQRVGVPVAMRGVTSKKVDEPLLCFQRQDGHDLVLNGSKILGSAQRRRRGAILQHGSLIRRKSTYAPHIPGFCDLCDVQVPTDFDQNLAIRLAESVADSWSLGELNENEVAFANELFQRIVTFDNQR